MSAVLYRGRLHAVKEKGVRNCHHPFAWQQRTPAFLGQQQPPLCPADGPKDQGLKVEDGKAEKYAGVAPEVGKEREGGVPFHDLVRRDLWKEGHL